jgi:hypothetical protein
VMNRDESRSVPPIGMYRRAHLPRVGRTARIAAGIVAAGIGVVFVPARSRVRAEVAVAPDSDSAADLGISAESGAETQRALPGLAVRPRMAVAPTSTARSEPVPARGASDAPRWRARIVDAISGALLRDCAESDLDSDGLPMSWAMPWPWFVWRTHGTSPRSPRARAYETIVPVHRPLDVRVRIVDSGGADVADAELDEWRIGGVSPASAQVGSEPGGERVVHGVPWIPGELLTLSVSVPVRGSIPPPTTHEDGRTTGRCSTNRWTKQVRTPQHVADGLFVRFVVDPAEEPSRYWVGGFRSGCGCGARNAVEIAAKSLGGARVVLRAAPGEPVAALRIHLLDRRVLTDAEGVARFAGLPEGDAVVSVVTSGTRYPPTTIRIVAGADVEATIRESAPASAVVRVVDEDLRPVPSATVTVVTSVASWADLSDAGVQRLDAWTDVVGVRECRNLPTGAVTFTARALGRTGSATVDVVEGGRYVVELVVR